jgi:integrase/recombinase XerD
VFFQTGIRVSELCSLTLSDVDLTDRTLTIQQGKGMADRTIELEKKGLQALRNKFAGITKKISPHSLRHTFATYKAERGVSPYQLQQWLGHRNLNTTQIYVHLDKM